MTPSDERPLGDDVLRRLLEALDMRGHAPAPSLKGRVLQRIADAEGGAGITTSRAGEGWVPLAPGVRVRILNEDGRSRSWLVRLEPGARLPAHAHGGDEESLLLEGTCELGGVTMHPGDYQLARAGSAHGEVSTVAGCLIFLRSASNPPEPA